MEAHVPVATILSHFQALYDLRLQIEGEGRHLDTLEASLTVDELGFINIAYKKQGQNLKEDPRRALVRYIDRHSPNARSMLLSVVPSLVKKCVYYASNISSIQENILYTLKELVAKDYPRSWWVGRFNNSLRREGYTYRWVGVDSIVLTHTR